MNDMIVNLLIFMAVMPICIVLFVIGCKILKCPDSLWNEMQRTPYNKSYDVYERFWNL